MRIEFYLPDFIWHFKFTARGTRLRVFKRAAQCGFADLRAGCRYFTKFGKLIYYCHDAAISASAAFIALALMPPVRISAR